MAPATELATIPLTSGAEIEDPASPAGKVWQSALDTIAQQDGFQRAYWGREVENPSVLQLFVGTYLMKFQSRSLPNPALLPNNA